MPYIVLCLGSFGKLAIDPLALTVCYLYGGVHRTGLRSPNINLARDLGARRHMPLTDDQIQGAYQGVSVGAIAVGVRGARPYIISAQRLCMRGARSEK